MEGYSTPAKAHRGQHKHHQHSHSGAASTPTETDSEHGSKSTNRRRHDRNGPHSTQTQPAWDAAVVNEANEGSFDSNGRYVSGPHESTHPDDSPAPVRGKKSRGSKSQTHNNAQMHQQAHAVAVQPMVTGSPAKLAYAGPTFHASPAASALPKPMFMSKSVPGDTKPTSLQSRLEQEVGDSGSSAASTPVVADTVPAAVAPPREESPLEFFFKADRAEKAKGQTPTGLDTPGGKPSLPIAQSAPPGNNWSNIYQRDNRHHQRTESSQSQRGVFALELDGTGIQPGRSPVQQTQGMQSATAPRPNSQAEGDPIRRFLLETAHGSSPSPKSSLEPPQSSSGYASDQPGASPFYRPQLGQRSSSGPSTPIPHAHPPSNSLHYGNRNLSPLFQAAKSPNHGTSQLRRELGASPPQQAGSQQWASIYQQHPNQYGANPPSHGSSGAPRSANEAPERYNHGSQTSQQPHDTKSMENDLRRILKLTASSNGATGVQG